MRSILQVVALPATMKSRVGGVRCDGNQILDGVPCPYDDVARDTGSVRVSLEKDDYNIVHP
jgi:hypothetical protein